MENSTGSDSWSDDLSCEQITNHWLYFIFSGYLLPLISPKLRRYFHEVINSCKNNEISGKVVTLTEFGFEKIQDIQNNHEMSNFIRRVCIDKNIEYDEELINHVSWLFSGDSDERHASIKQTWTRLNETINNLKDSRP
tara:strand:- start:480 stop:893 length:414 start_codon:yes stop_codon:yes gene_type:complete